MIVHQQQPTQWSCGVACAAMIAHSDVAMMLARLPSVRVSDHRRRFKREYVNVGELRRLVESVGVTVGRRTKGLPPQHAVAVLRVPNHRKTGWHWCVWSDGKVHDPMCDGPIRHEEYEPIRRAGVSFYQVEPWED